MTFAVIGRVRLLLLLACCVATAAATAAAQSGQRAPNILFLFADDLRADVLGAFGGTDVPTPHLDALAARGTALTNAFCMGSRHGAVCVASRAMLMTGRQLHRVPDDLADCITLPELLRERGYSTFLSGKWHNGDAALRRAFPQGRAVFRGGMCDHFVVPLCDLTHGEIRNQRTGDRHSSELFADATIEFLQRVDQDAPFFAYVAFTAPHDPRDPPPRWLQQLHDLPAPALPKNFRGQHGLDLGAATMTVRDENLLGWPRDPHEVQAQLIDYRALVAHLDEQVGRILSALAERGLADNTLVVFAADHGLAMGSHGLLGKQSLYEHSMRAPVIVAGPGIAAGQRRDGLVYLHDLMPTLLAAAGASTKAELDGIDLGPLLRGENGNGRAELLLSYAATQRALRTATHKLIRLPQIDRTLLFDLQHDPHELVDLAGDPAHAALLQQLQERLRGAQRAAGDQLPWTAAKVQPAMLDLTGKRLPPDRWQPPWIVDRYFPRRDPDLQAQLQPLAATAVFEAPDWHHWGASLLQDAQGRWHMFYSRWPNTADAQQQPDAFKDWLWRSEIAHATASSLDGPWQYEGVALAGRGAGHWDQLSVHNPRIRRFGDRFYLYYIGNQNPAGLDTDRSSRGPNWMRVRNSQRTGVAVAVSLDGPWQRFEEPLIAPGGPVTNVAVNPTMTQRHDGTFLAMVKGDAPGSRQHRYGMLLGAAPTGPFEWQAQAFDTGFGSEDPDIWYDRERRCYFALVTQTFRNQRRNYVGADGAIALFRSVDGLAWQDCEHPAAVPRTLRMHDGSERQFWRVERPGAVFDNKGKLVGIAVAVHPGQGLGNSKTAVLRLR